MTDRELMERAGQFKELGPLRRNLRRARKDLKALDNGDGWPPSPTRLAMAQRHYDQLRNRLVEKLERLSRPPSP